MALKKIKLGELVEPYSKKCGISNLTAYQISGVNKDKEFFEPSHQVGENTSNYQEVPSKFFACNLMHVGRDKVLPIAYNHTKDTKIVSPAYSVFSIRDDSPVSEYYFFLMLKSDERDRYFWFNTDASIRDGMSWDDFCSLEIEYPDLPTQQKYVDIYLAMVENQKAYERGLEDLKLTCDGFIEKLGDNYNKKLGPYIERNKYRNEDALYTKKDVRGFNNDGNFIKPMRLFSGEIKTFKIIKKGFFVYNSRINSEITKLSIAYNENDDLIVSPAYESFYVSNEKEIYSYYLYMLLQRKNFARKVLFNSFGSSTLVFGIEELNEFEFPIPDYSIQKSIADIYKVYQERKAINEQLKQQIKDICPILIKGSIEEGK